jgi:hypothetical protein
MDTQMVMVRWADASLAVVVEGRGSCGVVGCILEVAPLTPGQADAWPGKALEWEGGLAPHEGQLVEWNAGTLRFLGQAAW